MDKKNLIKYGSIALAVIIVLIIIMSLFSVDKKTSDNGSSGDLLVAENQKQNEEHELDAQALLNAPFDAFNKGVDSAEMQAQSSMENQPEGLSENTQNTTEQKPNTNAVEQKEEVKSESPKATAVQAAPKAVLFCDSFATGRLAEEQKAKLALSGGTMSQIEKRGDSFTLKIGPFNNRDEGRRIFAKLDSLGLVSKCSLEDAK